MLWWCIRFEDPDRFGPIGWCSTGAMRVGYRTSENRTYEDFIDGTSASWPLESTLPTRKSFEKGTRPSHSLGIHRPVLFGGAWLDMFTHINTAVEV